MKRTPLAVVALCIIFSLSSCGNGEGISKQSAMNFSNQSPRRSQETANQSADDSLSQYMTYTLPHTLVNGSYHQDLGYLGGNLFCLKSTGSCAAKKASDSTPSGWNSYGGVEMYYKLNCTFNHGQLTDVSLPWNHSMALTKAQPVDKCEASAVIVRVSHDLYTAAEAQASHMNGADLTSTMWYVFFAKENSNISYAVFLNTDYFSEGDVVSLAQSVKFKDNAFNVKVN